MKINIRSTIYFTLFILINWSCILQQEEDNFVQIDQIADPRYLADLVYSYDFITFYPAKDTFFLSPSEVLYLRFDGGQMYQFVAEIDGNTVAEESEADFLSINGGDHSLGYHVLKLTQWVKSGTGSLADKLDAELVSYTSTFVISIDEYSFKPEMKIELKNGTVELTWNAFNRGDFQEYEMRKYELSTGPYDLYRKLTVADQQQVSLNDSTYVGGRCTYVLLVNRGGKYFRSKDYPINFPYKPEMQLTKLPGGRARLTWNDSPFYNNISSIKVSGSSYGAPIYTVDNLHGDKSSVEMDYNLLFGQLAHFNIQFSAKVDSYKLPIDKFSVFDDLTYGIRTPPISDILYNQQEGAYYLAFYKKYYNEYPEGIYKLDADLNVTDTLVYDDFFNAYVHVIQSPDGNHVYVLHDFRILELDNNPLRIKESYHTGSYFGSFSRQHFAASNNNFILFRHSNSAKVLDFATKQTLISVSGSTASHISPDGQYFVNGTNFYKFNGSQFLLTDTLPFSNIKFLYFLKSENRLLIATTEKVIIYDYINQVITKEYSFNSPENGNPDFNELTMEYSIRHNDLVILDVDTGEQRRLPLSDYHTTINEGEYLFSHLGFGLKEY